MVLLGGNQHPTSSAHSRPVLGPPGLMPAASIGAMYFRSVLRSTPRLCAELGNYMSGAGAALHMRTVMLG